MLQIASHPVNSIHKCSTTVPCINIIDGFWPLKKSDCSACLIIQLYCDDWNQSICPNYVTDWCLFRWTIKTNHLLLFTFQVNTEMIYYRLPHLMSGSTSNQDVSQSVIRSIPVNQSTNKRILCQWRRPGIGNRNIQWAMSIGFDFSAIPREYFDLIPTKIPLTI